MRPRLVRTTLLAVLAPGFALTAACGDDPVDPCEGVSGTCVAIAAGADREAIQTAFIEVEPGATIAFPPGVFTIEGPALSLDVDGVTIKGAGMDETVLDLEATTGAQGVLVTADDFTIEDIGLEDGPGDLIKVEGADGVTFRRVRVEWTRGPNSDNGFYGIYPVQCSNVLIEDSVAIASADAGIYVGQSDNIIVRRSRAEQNVAGIEIENSTRADVYDNVATGNTGGILVFNLPGLEVANGAGTRVYDNEIVDNNEPNFGDPGTTVGKLPAGTGIALLAAHEVEVFGNTISNHQTVNLGIVSYDLIDDTVDDPEFDPHPDTIYIHDNTFSGTSTNPTGELGALIILGLSEVQGSVMVPDITWDGIVPAAKADPQDPNALRAELNICVQDNGDADFGNLHWPNLEAPEASFDAAPHDCAHTPLPAVVLE